MIHEKLQALALASPILVAALAPDTAEACPYNGCKNFDFWTDLAPVNAAKIPTDGVLVLQGTHEGGADQDWLEKIDLSVTKDGQPIAGALEATSQHGVLIWRPAAPWEPGTTLQMTGKVNNQEFDDYYNCADMEIPFASDLVIDSEPGAPLGEVELTGVVEHESLPEVTLETLACCPGADPNQGYANCDGSENIYWNDDTCAPTMARGYLDVALTGTPATTGPAAQQVVYRLKVDGAVHSAGLTPDFHVRDDAPVCAVVEAEDLASGAVTVGAEQCFGQDLAAVLGPQPLDPTEKLDCPLQQCEVVMGSWDLTQCTPFETEPSPTTSDTTSDSTTAGEPETGSTGVTASGEPPDSGEPQDGEKGCACAVVPDSGAGLLALVGVLGLARRRRVRR